MRGSGIRHKDAVAEAHAEAASRLLALARMSPAWPKAFGADEAARLLCTPGLLFRGAAISGAVRDAFLGLSRMLSDPASPRDGTARWMAALDLLQDEAAAAMPMAEEALCAHLDMLSDIVDAARASAPDAIVFGSALHEGVPADLDLMLAADPKGGHARALLALAREHYGMLDVFVDSPGGTLLVRNPDATGYVRAARAREIRKSAACGIPLRDFDFMEAVAPRRGLGPQGPN